MEACWRASASTGRQKSINEGIFKRDADSRVCDTGEITGYEDCEADVVVWREDEAGVVHTDVAVFGVEVCDTIVGILDADYFPRSTDGCVKGRKCELLVLASGGFERGREG